MTRGEREVNFSLIRSCSDTMVSTRQTEDKGKVKSRRAASYRGYHSLQTEEHLTVLLANPCANAFYRFYFHRMRRTCFESPFVAIVSGINENSCHGSYPDEVEKMQSCKLVRHNSTSRQYNVSLTYAPQSKINSNYSKVKSGITCAAQSPRSTGEPLAMLGSTLPELRSEVC